MAKKAKNIEIDAISGADSPYWDQPIIGRKDFTGNIFSSLIPEHSGGTGKGKYFPDLSNYYQGDQDYKYKYLSKSRYAPSNAKNNKSDYIAINDPDFKNAILNIADNPRSDKSIGYNTIGAKTRVVYADGVGDLGRFSIYKGRDERGDYVSYYDKYDIDSQNVVDKLGAAKAYEIYDRIYRNTNNNMKKQYKSGGRLSRSFGFNGPDYSTGGNLYFLGGVKSPTTMHGNVGNVAGSIGGMIPTNTKGGAAASGALQGASLGMNFGPIGAGVGALLGGAAGFIGQDAKMKHDEFEANANDMKQRNELLGIKAMGGYILPQGVSANMTTQYAEGVFLNEFNNGGSHESNPQNGVPQGIAEDGQPNLVEQGETKYQDYIFSDRLKLNEKAVNDHNLPKSMINKTFADASKRIAKLHKERPNDPITRDTMKSKMNHLMQANDEIREYEQSSLMAMGGHLYDKGAKLNTVRAPYKETLGQPSSIINKPFVPGLMFDPIKDIDQLNKVDSNLFTGTTGSKFKPNLDFLKDSKNLRYAPIAFDTLAATGMFGKSPKPETYSPSLIKQQGSLSAPQINEEAMRSKIDAAYQNQIRGLAGASGGSGAALRSGLTGLSNDYMSAVGQVFLGAETANNQAQMQADQYNLGTAGSVASQNAQMMNQAEMYNNQLLNQNKALNYDTRMSYLGKGVEGLGDIGYEQRNAEILPRLYGYNQYSQYAPTNAKACGGRMRMLKRKK